MLRRYRPKEMSDLVSHEDIISTITRLIDAGKLPHLLLYGPPGTGKTSTILACAHKLYGKHFASMVLELNASDDRGLDVVRERIKEFASTRIMFSAAPKMIILDEADNMTGAAQAALRRVIEKYTRNAVSADAPPTNSALARRRPRHRQRTQPRPRSRLSARRSASV